jgi:hypothetical protein
MQHTAVHRGAHPTDPLLINLLCRRHDEQGSGEPHHREVFHQPSGVIGGCVNIIEHYQQRCITDGGQRRINARQRCIRALAYPNRRAGWCSEQLQQRAYGAHNFVASNKHDLDPVRVHPSGKRLHEARLPDSGVSADDPNRRMPSSRSMTA